ncbi:MAG: hypothetical protein ACOY90_20595 [Candidatus Zhuqueibacterota bacterium]
MKTTKTFSFHWGIPGWNSTSGLSLWPILFLAIALLFFCHPSVAAGQADSLKFRFIYNNDGTEILGNRWHQFRPLTIDDVHSYVDILADGGVTTFMICTGSTLVYYDSKIERPLGLDRDGNLSDDCSEKKLGEDLQSFGRNYLALKEQGTDIVTLCVNRAKEKGMEAFITMRMNDLHFTDPNLTCPPAQSSLWLDHSEWRLGDHPGWHADGALNFAHPGVRQYKLNLIREQCERFAIDGIELDFMRFIVYFPYNKGHEYLAVMTEFMQQARTIVTEVGAKQGRPILLAVRVPARFDLALAKGLDVAGWVNSHLVDMISISSHWLGDPALPVREFKAKLGATSIPVYASIECGQYNPYLFLSHGMYRATASHCLGQGADGIYLFNFSFPEYWSQPEQTSPDRFINSVRTPALLRELSDSDRLAGRNKLYTLSDGCVEYGYRPDTPLPIFISPWDEKELELELAENVARHLPVRALLFLRIKDPGDVIVSFNGATVEQADHSLAATFERDKGLQGNDSVAVYSIPAKLLTNGKQLITLRSIAPRPMFLIRVELAIEYGQVHDCGYF